MIATAGISLISIFHIDQLPTLKTFDENGVQVGDVLIEKSYEFEKHADEEIRRLRGFSP